MTSDDERGLLTSRDAGPVELVNREGGGRFLLLGDHAGNLVPERLAGLGLDPADLHRHIALDLGVAELGRRLAAALDTPFAAQRYSRLVIDCNRALSDEGSIAVRSDGVIVPGNAALTRAERYARVRAIFQPYHDAIAALLAERDARGCPTIVVSLHSFTPNLSGVERPWQVGVLYGGGDERFAWHVLAALKNEGDLVVGDNQPYQFDDTDFTVPQHAIAAGLAYVELEIRQDEIADRGQLGQWASRLARILAAAAAASGV